jgi:hypothetical protein
MRFFNLISSVLAICFSIVFAVPLAAQEAAPPEQELQGAFPKKPPYSPYADRHFPERVYWGDTHLGSDNPRGLWKRMTGYEEKTRP